MIFECGPKGADVQVCEYLAEQLLPGVQVKSETLDDKPNLLANAAAVAKNLLADGCERVLIIWDLRPAWPDTKLKPCRAAERQTLLHSLAKEGLQNAPVYLVCVEQEFEFPANQDLRYRHQNLGSGTGVCLARLRSRQRRR